jgi:hypothetical protein
MEAEKKFSGALYHFQRMEEVYLKNEEKLTYELEAFLVKIRSIPDVLLEDFNQKFSLGIGLERKLTPKIFRKKAQELGGIQATEFIKWWEEKKREIESGPLGSILFKKRNISVHRKVVAPDLKRITLTATVDLSYSITVKNEKGKIINELEMPPRSRKPEPQKIDWCFNEFPSEDVLGISKKLLQMVKEFIEEAKSRFN